MEVEYVVCVCLALSNLLVTIAGDGLKNSNKIEVYDGPPGGCMYVDCSADQVCVYRRFMCRVPPCPGMLYCSRSETESLKGPTTCETVQCPHRHVCMIKVRRCRWDIGCERQIARCASLKEFHEGPASCAGFKCPQGKQCILRESFCAKPPCRLLRSCSSNRDVHLWLGRCRSLGCPSEHECFLRRPENNCISPTCKHEPDCITTDVNQVIGEHCRGWMCPRWQACAAEIVGACEGNDCDVKRSCRESGIAVTRRDETQDEEKRTDTPQLWLDHLNSKTELDAFELCIKNAEEQKDFKEFQHWLRSIKNILDSGSYGDWLGEILSSRGEEFRKWVRASSLDEPGAVTENPYRDGAGTKGAWSLDDLNKRVEEIESFLRDKNLTSVLEDLLVPNRILLPPRTALETALLNNLRGSNRSLFFNYLLKYPFYVGNQFLSVQPRIENRYDRPYLVVPVERIKDLANNGPIVDRDSHDAVNLRDNLSPAKEEAPSLWVENANDPVEDSIDATKKEEDKPGYFDDIPADVLESFLKSSQLFPIDKQSGERGQDDSATIITVNEEHNLNFEWSPPSSEVREDTTERNDNINQFSLLDDDHSEAKNKEPRISIFVDKLDDESINHSGQLDGARLSSEVNENNDDLDLFLELNKESLLPYIRTLMEVANAGDDQMEPRPDQGSVKNFLNDANKPSDRSAVTGSKVTAVKVAEDDGRGSNSVGTVDREKDSEPVSIYLEQEPNIRRLYNLPSFGASNGEIHFQNYPFVDRANSKSSNNQ